MGVVEGEVGRVEGERVNVYLVNVRVVGCGMVL